MKQKTKIAYELKKVGSTEIVNKVRESRFQVTVMKIPMVKTCADESQRDFIPEQSFDRIRTAIQYSTYKKLQDKWDNQVIWINNPAELVHLRDAINEILGEASDEASSSSLGGEQDE